MNLFLILLFPVLIVFYILIKLEMPGGKEVVFKKIPAAFYGLCSGAVLDTIYAFFVFSYEYQGNGVAAFAFLDWIPGFIVPSLFFVFFLFWSNDSWKERVESYFYFIYPFYAVYLPSFTLKQHYAQSFFPVLVRPVVFAVLGMAVARMVLSVFGKVNEKSWKVIVPSLIILGISFLPSLLTALWYFGVNILVILILSAGAVALNLFLAGFNFKENYNQLKLIFKK